MNAGICTGPQRVASIPNPRVPLVEIIQGDVVLGRDGPALVALLDEVELVAARRQSILGGRRRGDAVARGGGGGWGIARVPPLYAVGLADGKVAIHADGWVL